MTAVYTALAGALRSAPVLPSAPANYYGKTFILSTWQRVDIGDNIRPHGSSGGGGGLCTVSGCPCDRYHPRVHTYAYTTLDGSYYVDVVDPVYVHSSSTRLIV